MGPTLFGVPAPAPSQFLPLDIRREWTSVDPRASFFGEIPLTSRRDMEALRRVTDEEMCV